MTYPKSLFNTRCWSCRDRGEVGTMAEFGAEVLEYQLDILQSDDHWKPDDVALKSGEVTIGYMAWDEAGERQLDRTFSLAADDGEAFSELELFYKTCRGLIEDATAEGLSLHDHHFFEGLSGSGDTPFYFIRFGS